MRAFAYRIVTEWSEEDDVYVARVPALPGCAAHGDTVEDAAREAREAAEAMLDVLTEDGQPLPPADATADFSGNIRLRLPRSLHEKLARLADSEGVSLNQLMVSILAAEVGGVAHRGIGIGLDRIGASEGKQAPPEAPSGRTAKTGQATGSTRRRPH